MEKLKLVEFDKYCSKCEHKSVKETEDPCNECLTYPAVADSHKPVKFEERIKNG